MRVLLDECLPRKLRQAIRNHEVQTVPEMGWAGKTNGELLRLAERRFAVFITADQNLRYQQRLARATLAVLILATPDSRLETLLQFIPQISETLKTIQKGQAIRLKLYSR